MSALAPAQGGSKSEGEAREARRLARQDWQMKRYDLGHEPSDDLSKTTSPQERLAMVWPLTKLSWRLAGRQIPDYARCDVPGRVVRSSGAGWRSVKERTSPVSRR